MKSIKFFLFYVGIVFILSGCGTSNKTTISSSADLKEYNYATLTNVMMYKSSPVLMELSVRIYDALSETRLKVIGDKEISELSENDKMELLLVQYAAHQNINESVVSINFVEYLSGKPVASFRGAFGMGITLEQDMDIAIKNALNQMKEYF
ncbi:hypothetical protein [Mailhella massiliensis]|uniref:hypothetical protein n=1 Tax=Mailhella massiliensis TaxID=1903261 RepID=UPI001185AC51|nr:hypothetical protein [Mailhella massiliensis]